MSDFYSPQHRQIQDQHDSRNLADGIEQTIVETQANEQHQHFIESRDFFFLTTIDHRGYPTCSYKGGNRGLVKLIKSQTLVFPSYNGNVLIVCRMPSRLVTAKLHKNLAAPLHRKNMALCSLKARTDKPC